MASIEEEKPFDRMVPIRIPGGARMIGTTAEAARELLERWPDEGMGRKHLAARKACLTVLQGLSEARKAREAFEAAAKESNILGEGLLDSLQKAVQRSKRT
jgi:hypothetical protein